MLKIEDEQFSWVETLKKDIANCNSTRKIIIYSEKDINGLLGLCKCLVEEFFGEDNPIR